MTSWFLAQYYNNLVYHSMYEYIWFVMVILKQLANN